jgi:hypothetical protein
MRQLNNEQKFIVNDTILKKNNCLNFYTFFWLDKCWHNKMFIFWCIIWNMLCYYIEDIIDVNPLKPKAMKLFYIGKHHLVLMEWQLIKHLESLWIKI